MAIRLALFDYDGTIVFTETIHTRRLTQRLDHFGIRYTAKDLAVLAGANPSTRPSLFDHCFNHQASYHQHRQELLEHRPNPLDETDLSALIAPGIADFLIYLYQRNIPCAICTNSSSKRIEEGLRTLNIGSYFRHIYSGYELCHDKPDPYIYELAMRQYNASPHETIIFEDSSVGLQGAGKTGAHICAVVDPKSLIHPDISEFSIASFREAPAIIEALSSQ